jgi:hypothetical protein
VAPGVLCAMLTGPTTVARAIPNATFEASLTIVLVSIN